MGFYSAYYILPSILLLYLVRKYRESKWTKCQNNVKLDGKIAIVTGANSGIGFEIAKELAARNAEVVIACRSMEKASTACFLISSQLGTEAKLSPMELDLASLKSIKHFNQEIRKSHNKINILINNAGVSYPSSKKIQTEDNFEIHMGVNHLGHFYLTKLLLDLLSVEPSRVIVVASTLYERGELNLDDLNSRGKKESSFYSNSKLANVYFGQELARRTENMNIKVYICCPGWVYTGLFRNHVRWYHYILVAPIAFFFMRSPVQGAQTPIYCATDPEVADQTGLLYRDCKTFFGRTIFSDDVAKKLWEVSEKMIDNDIERGDCN